MALVEASVTAPLELSILTIEAASPAVKVPVVKEEPLIFKAPPVSSERLPVVVVTAMINVAPETVVLPIEAELPEVVITQPPLKTTVGLPEAPL